MPPAQNPSNDPAAGASNATQDLLSEAGHATNDTEFHNPMPPGYEPGRHK